MTFHHDSSSSPLRYATSILLWPALYVGGLAAAGLAFATSSPVLWFNVVYLSVVAIIALFERLMPYEPAWLAPDGETLNNLGHTFLTKGIVQIAAAFGASFPLLVAIFAQPFFGSQPHIWPAHWSMISQVVLGLVISEFGLYAAHRLAHERLGLWRFHALHHSVTRLWVLNTGRFHVIDSLIKVSLSQLPLYLLGAPLPVFLWIGAVTAFTGLLTHCNVEMRTGPLDWVFSTPRLHRWHHSKDLAEGNSNYGENIVLWDQLFGTYFNPDRPSSTDIGITGKVSRSFIGQLVQPFSKSGARQILGRKPSAD
ncbi:sterol desaturase [Sinorhizobium sp. A49]|uniref:sterol desaturase family protein n=1 Tax=Sinorhizobium sp. A49 TaxID=1945861 RepID=UPI000986ED1E|nr:sterol desaturase family protein [Sinorhizobium sp. A49]OOG65863.1 sterol desaturase [Sinorhizobium sp. A49]